MAQTVRPRPSVNRPSASVVVFTALAVPVIGPLVVGVAAMRDFFAPESATETDAVWSRGNAAAISVVATLAIATNAVVYVALGRFAVGVWTIVGLSMFGLAIAMLDG